MRQAQDVGLIVPMHDSAAFLPRLIASLKAQESRSFEVIFVDDRSSDDPVSVLQTIEHDFAYRYVRLPEGRQGPGAARNYGMTLVSTEFIGFIDSDDRIHPRYVSYLLAEANRSGADVVETLYLGVDDFGHPLSVPELKPYLSSDDRFLSVLSGDMGRTSWAKLYRRSLLIDHGIVFPERIENGEDHVFLLEVYSHGPKVATVYDNLYYWVRRQDSLTGRGVSHKTIDDFFEVASRKRVLAERRADPEVFDCFVRRLFKEARVLTREIKERGRAGRPGLIEHFLDRLTQPEWEPVVELIAARQPGYYSDVVTANREYLSMFEQSVVERRS